MHSHPTIVTLYDLICILAVVTKTDTADEDVLGAPGLGPVLQGILGKGERELHHWCSDLRAQQTAMVRKGFVVSLHSYRHPWT